MKKFIFSIILLICLSISLVAQTSTTAFRFRRNPSAPDVSGNGAEVYYDTVTNKFRFRDNSAWNDLDFSALLSGSGTSGRVAFWNGTKSLSSDSGFTFDSTNDDLTIGRDIIAGRNVSVLDEVYGSGWNGSTNVPTKNAIFDKIESISFSPPGSNTQVIFNDGGIFGADSGFVYNKTTDALTISGEFISNKLSLVGTAGPNIQRTGNNYFQFGANNDFTTILGGVTASGVNGLFLSNNGMIAWPLTGTGSISSFNVAIMRSGDGALEINNGTLGTFRDFKFRAIKIGSTTTKPTCDSSNRGFIYHVYGGAGVKDTVEICAKDASDVYDWRVLY